MLIGQTCGLFADHTVCLLAVHYENPTMEGTPHRLACCLFQCRAEGDAEETLDLKIMDLAFFDNDTLLVVARTGEPETGENSLGEWSESSWHVDGNVKRAVYLWGPSRRVSHFGILRQRVRGHIEHFARLLTLFWMNFGQVVLTC